MNMTTETHSNTDYLYLTPETDDEGKCLREFARAYEPIVAYIDANSRNLYPTLIIRKKKRP